MVMYDVEAKTIRPTTTNRTIKTKPMEIMFKNYYCEKSVLYGHDEYINELIIINIYDINYKPASR